MDLTNRTRDEWIEQYLRGDLTPEEQIEFETEFIRDQQLLEDVEVAAAFRLREAHVAPRSKPSHRRWWMPVLVAASVLAVALLITLRPGKQTVAEANVRIVTLGLYRGAGESVRHLDTSNAERVLFEVPAAGAGELDVRWLTHPAGDTLTITGLRDSGDGYVTFLVDAHFLSSGLHRLEVGDGDRRQEFSFTID